MRRRDGGVGVGASVTGTMTSWRASGEEVGLERRS